MRYTMAISLHDGPRHARPLIDYDELRRSLVLGYGVTALTAILAVLVVRTDRGNVGLLSVAGFEICLAVLLAAGRSMPVWMIKVAAFPIATAVISAVVAFAAPIGPAPLYYVWPALTCGSYGSRNDARWMMVALCTTFAVALSVAHNAQVPPIMYVSVVSIVGVVLAIHRRDRVQLAYAATTDGLTGLLNRRAFGEAFGREVERARVAKLPLSLTVFDLDHFKDLNDGFGHAAGDEALRAFSAILLEQCSAADLVARVGGEEFAVVLFDTDVSGTRATVDRIAQSLAQWSLDAPTTLTTSAGIAMLGPDAGSPSELLVAADRALYAAKHAGRNRVVEFGDRTARELAQAA